jgi:hypothetical protein
MPKAKPVSLHPLTFHEALKAIISVDPDRVGLTPKRRKSKKKKRVQASLGKTNADNQLR